MASTSGFSFGQPQTSTAQPANKSLFGTPSSTPGGGFSFGTSTTATQPVTSTSGFSLGGGTSGGFSFGQQAAAATPSTAGFSFTPTPAAVTSTSGFTLGGTPAPTTTGFTLGATTLTPATTTTAPTVGFQLPASTAPATSSGLSFNLWGTTAPAPAAAPASTGFSFPGGGLKVTSSQPPASSAACLKGVSHGLGGAQPPSASADANNAGSKPDGKSTKDQQLTQDLFATIAVFESRRSAENAASEVNIRQTVAPFHKVGNKAVEIQKLLAELTSEYLQLHSSAMNLKAEVMKESEHVEMARRTKETPMPLQGGNKAPEMFFINLVRSFEAEMLYCRSKIEEVSQCMQAANNPCETPEDIAEVLQREHETLKELAAKIYSHHTKLVELSKILKTKAVPNEQAFFRLQLKEDVKTPASAVVRPVLGGSSSGLQVFQEHQQKAKAVTLGAAPPTMPLAQTTMPSLFSSGSNPSTFFSSGGTSFGSNTFNLGTPTSNTSFGTKPLFGNASSTFGNTSTFGTNTSGVQQTTSPFAITSPFNTKPFGS